MGQEGQLAHRPQQRALGGSGRRTSGEGRGGMATLFVLFESASGFALLEQTESDEIGQYLEEMQSAMCDLSRLSKVLKLKAFVPFKSAEEALAAANDSSEGLLNDTLKDFLEMNLPSGKKAEKKGKIELGVLDSKLGSAIQEELGIKCTTRDPVPELLRAVRLHITRYIKGLEEGDQQRASLGLAHSYSRSKVKFNVNRQDNMIIQSISLLDTLDKDINTFAMRIKEWYGWHFPELVKIVSDNYKYARCVRKIQVHACTAAVEGCAGVVVAVGSWEIAFRSFVAEGAGPAGTQPLARHAAAAGAQAHATAGALCVRARARPDARTLALCSVVAAHATRH